MEYEKMIKEKPSLASSLMRAAPAHPLKRAAVAVDLFL